MASQALLVVLAPTIVEVGREFGTSVGAVGQARSALAGAAIAASFGIAPLLERLGVRPLLLWGALLAMAGSAGAALSPSFAVFLAVHVVTGIGFACLLSAGFAGVAAFRGEDRMRTMGYVVGANALAWIVVNPLAGAFTDVLSWRAAYAVPMLLAFSVIVSAHNAPDRGAAGTTGIGLRGVLADPSARRWVLAEILSLFAWGTYLTFIGAYFIERHGVGESATGLVLAIGAAAFFATAVRGAPLLSNLSRRHLISAVLLVMALLIPLQFATDDILWIGLLIFFLAAAAGGLRGSVASSLGLAQLPDHPGSMMAARTAATQTGYLLGGLIGGAALAWGGYTALGMVLATGLVLCALLILRVSDPKASANDGPTTAKGARP